MPRIPKAPVLLGAGLLSAGLLGLTGTGTLSAITAQITNDPNTVSLSRLVMELKSAGQTCLSNQGGAGSGNAYTCTTIQPLTGRGDLIPGQQVTSTVVATNRGGVTPSRFVLTPGACAPTGDVSGSTTTAAKNDICSKVLVTISVTANGVTTSMPQTSAAGLAAASPIELPQPAPGDSGAVTVKFDTTTPSGLTNDYQGLGVSMPMVWTFQQ